ncbi:DNA-binding response regulator [Halostreptopolyspora alba]|uniref:DNA-binding response regulator n=2 Tax=Halostreptopolyspora alba TaxID=2487137 RepID=A0A3N0EC06_9ACTN|nr:DNA-binding response regulator [Nocardiopsaceae bacterium YIM 96095]
MRPERDERDEIRVLLVDDDALALRTVCSILESDEAITVAGQEPDGLAACRWAAENRADVALMDIRMPHRDGLEALRTLRTTAPNLAVVMLTTFSRTAYVEQALAAGAAGFLLKTAGPEEMVMGVRAAASGGMALSPRVARWVVATYGPRAADHTNEATQRIAALTERQRHILSVLATGASNAEIGRRLHLSEGTVKGYVSDLMLVLQVRNRVEAAILAHQAGLTG